MNKNNIALMIVVAIIAILGTAGTANAFYIGQRGHEVEDIQITLIEAGFDIPAITSGKAAFGYFGNQTQAALAAYEASKKSEPKFGAVSGPDFFFPYFGINGVKLYGSQQRLLTGTTTPCTFKAPSATSSLQHFLVNALNSTTTVAVWSVGKAFQPNATTTNLFRENIAANAVRSVMATTTTNNFVISPNEYISLGVQGGGFESPVSSFTGTCSALFVTGL